MPDTQRTTAELLDLFADNTSGSITAQDARDFIVSADPDTILRVGSVGTTLTDGTNLSVDGVNRQLVSVDGYNNQVVVADWSLNSRNLNDYYGSSSINFGDRQLLDSGGNLVGDWSNPGNIGFQTPTICVDRLLTFNGSVNQGGFYSIDVGNRQLLTADNQVVANWNGGTLQTGTGAEYHFDGINANFAGITMSGDIDMAGDVLYNAASIGVGGWYIDYDSGSNALRFAAGSSGNSIEVQSSTGSQFFLGNADTVCWMSVPVGALLSFSDNFGGSINVTYANLVDTSQAVILDNYNRTAYQADGATPAYSFGAGFTLPSTLPASPVAGMIGFDTDNHFKGFNGTEWVQLD